MNVCSLYVCTFISLAHTYFVHSYFSVWYFCYFFSIFLFQSFNFVAIASIIYYVLHMHTFFLFLKIYIKPIENLCFSDFSSIFSLNFGKKCIRQAAFVFLLFQICQCMDVLSEFYLQGNRTGCHWKERLSDRLDFVFFFSLRLFCLFFSFIIWNIKSDDSSSPNMTNNAVLLPAYTATKSFAFPHTCRGHDVCCTATRSAALQHLNSWLCQYS